MSDSRSTAARVRSVWRCDDHARLDLAAEVDPVPAGPARQLRPAVDAVVPLARVLGHLVRQPLAVAVPDPLERRLVARADPELVEQDLDHLRALQVRRAAEVVDRLDAGDGLLGDHARVVRRARRRRGRVIGVAGEHPPAASSAAVAWLPAWRWSASTAAACGGTASGARTAAALVSASSPRSAARVPVNMWARRYPPGPREGRSERVAEGAAQTGSHASRSRLPVLDDEGRQRGDGGRRLPHRRHDPVLARPRVLRERALAVAAVVVLQQLEARVVPRDVADPVAVRVVGQYDEVRRLVLDRPVDDPLALGDVALPVVGVGAAEPRREGLRAVEGSEGRLLREDVPARLRAGQVLEQPVALLGAEHRAPRLEVLGAVAGGVALAAEGVLVRAVLAPVQHVERGHLTPGEAAVFPQVGTIRLAVARQRHVLPVRPVAHLERLGRHAAADDERIGRQPRPQHDACGTRIARRDAERERVVEEERLLPEGRPARDAGERHAGGERAAGLEERRGEGAASLPREVRADLDPRRGSITLLPRRSAS